MLDNHCNLDYSKMITIFLLNIDNKIKKNIANIFYKVELQCHKGKMQDTVKCIKRIIGTNRLAQLIFEKSNSSYLSSVTQSLNNFFLLKILRNTFSAKIFCIYIKHTFIAILKIFFYYADLIKDIIFIVIPANVLLSSLTTFNSFGTQIFYLMWISILLPWIVNFCLLLALNPFQCYKSRIVRVLFAILSPFAPGISISIVSRYRMKQEIISLNNRKNLSYTDIHELSQKFENFETQINGWSKLVAILKLNEVTFENLIQSTLLIVVILLKYSKTATVVGLHELFVGDDFVYIVFSAIWSVFSMMFTATNRLIMSKNGFIPLSGKIIINTFNFLSVIVRTFSLIVYFSPSLGLLNLLQHYKFGSMPISEKSLIYDVKTNGTIIYFKEAWMDITSYETLTVFNLGTYYTAFLTMIGIHYIIVVLIKYRYAVNFRKKGCIIDKIFHVLSQLQCPSSYKDWDEDDESEETYEPNFVKILLEMKYLLIVFTLEHIFMCIPIWILSYNITIRNIYLNEYFPMLEEELFSTKLAYILSAICPVLFIATSFAQYSLFVMYHRKGHPWSKILFPDVEKIKWSFIVPTWIKQNFKNLKKKREKEDFFKDFWNNIQPKD